MHIYSTIFYKNFACCKNIKTKFININGHTFAILTHRLSPAHNTPIKQHKS